MITSTTFVVFFIYKKIQTIIVSMPVVAIAIELIAPASKDISIAFEVPTAWLAIPKDNPLDIQSLSLNILVNNGPKVEPKIPVKITAAIVISGMPPILIAISFAIAVVTDLGINEIYYTSYSNEVWIGVILDFFMFTFIYWSWY